MYHCWFVHSAELRTPSSKTFGSIINKGPISEVESVSMLDSNERCYALQKNYHNCVPQTGSFSQDNMQAVRAQRSNNVVAQCMDLLQHNLDVQVLCNTSYFLWSDPEKPWRR